MRAKVNIWCIAENENESKNLKARPEWCAISPANGHPVHFHYYEEIFDENDFAEWLTNPDRKNESALGMLANYQKV